MAQPVAVYTDAAEEHPIVSLIGWSPPSARAARIDARYGTSVASLRSPEEEVS